MKKIIMATAASLLLIGCGDSAPECGADDVKTSVLANFKTHLYNEFRISGQIKGYEEQVSKWKDKIVNGGLSEADKKYYEKEIKNAEFTYMIPKYKRWLEILDSSMISTIRTDGMDDKAKKSTCSAVINISEPMHFMAPYTSYDIAYSASITSDGKLFTELNKSELNRKGEQYKYPPLK